MGSGTRARNAMPGITDLGPAARRACRAEEEPRHDTPTDRLRLPGSSLPSARSPPVNAQSRPTANRRPAAGSVTPSQGMLPSPVTNFPHVCTMICRVFTSFSVCLFFFKLHNYMRMCNCFSFSFIHSITLCTHSGHHPFLITVAFCISFIRFSYIPSLSLLSLSLDFQSEQGTRPETSPIPFLQIGCLTR